MPIATKTVRAARLRALLSALALLGAPAAAQAGEHLRMGIAVETRTLDPHQSASAPNAQALRHVYDTLIRHDEAHRLMPGLALSWAMDPADPARWTIRLRPGVRFHDGQAFGAADVIASLARAVDVPRGLGGFASYLRQVTSITVVGDLTLEIRTTAPHAGLPYDLTAAMIVPRRAAEAPAEAFNSGAMAIGTGPYRIAAWRRGTSLDLARNPEWWGPAQPWARVSLVARANDAARVSALLAGEVELIEQVPTSALETLRRRDDTTLVQAVTSRLIFLSPDMMRQTTPFFTDAAGRPLEPNPLRDARVRRALSLAIDRGALVTQVMGGAATPAGQLMPEGMPGTSTSLPPDRFDPEEARRLLRAAGVPEGARIVLHGPNDRYLNDEKVLVAIATMLRRVGLAPEPVVAPFSIHRARQRRGEASLTLHGWATETGDASLALRAIVGAPGRPTGWGQVNFAAYANEEFETALAAALRQTDPALRSAGLARATEMAIRDGALVPLYFQQAVWATRRGTAYAPRADEYTLAVSARPVR